MTTDINAKSTAGNFPAVLFMLRHWSVSRVLSLTAIYLAPRLLAGSSHLLEAVGSTCMLLHGVAPDRVYIVQGAHLEKLFSGAADLSPHLGTLKTLKYMQYSGGFQCLICGGISRCPIKFFSAMYPTHVSMGRVGSYPTFSALLPGINDVRLAVYLCCTCPGVTPGGRYPLSLPCGARTFLIRCLSACVRGCPTWSLKYCTASG